MEKLPSKEETTGIAFNYDEPDTEPPQTMLLAVTPVKTGRWTWDDVVDTVNDTLDMAKKRSMHPATFEDTGYGQVLPAVMAAVTYQNKGTISTDFRNNMEPAGE